MKKVVYVSRILKWTAIAFCVAMPIFEVGYWMTNGYPFLESILRCSELPVFGSHPVGWQDLNHIQKFLGFLTSMIPLVFSIAALFYLSQLLKAFEHLKFFESQNVQILKKAGWALCWGQIAHLPYTALLSLILTYRNPPGMRNITLGLGTHELEVLIIGLSILLISWVFTEAVKLHEEQTGTV